MINFKGKVALVTGGTRGIGKATCDLLSYSGCEVMATGTKPIKCGKNARGVTYFQLDFLDKRSTDNFITMLSTIQKIDILINNAGINIIEPIYKIDEESWDKVLKVNLTGPMLIANKVSSIMKKRKKGRILNVSSIFGLISRNGRDSYSASKAGLIGLTRAMALDLAPHNILVNALCPGFTATELTKSMLSPSEIRSLAQDVPLSRFAAADEIAIAACFLCSELNTYMTGQTIVVDGGYTIK
jgi:3-oxoacyl-[acyl-carrier protein] reductase